MKTTMLMTILSILSLPALANYSCSGSEVRVEINTGSKTITISGDYNGVIKNYNGGGDQMYGNASSGDISSATVDVEEGEIVIITDKRYNTGILDIDC